MTTHLTTPLVLATLEPNVYVFSKTFTTFTTSQNAFLETGTAVIDESHDWCMSHPSAQYYTNYNTLTNRVT